MRRKNLSLYAIRKRRERMKLAKDLLTILLQFSVISLTMLSIFFAFSVLGQ